MQTIPRPSIQIKFILCHVDKQLSYNLKIKQMLITNYIKVSLYTANVYIYDNY